MTVSSKIDSKIVSVVRRNQYSIYTHEKITITYVVVVRVLQNLHTSVVCEENSSDVPVPGTRVQGTPAVYGETFRYCTGYRVQGSDNGSPWTITSSVGRTPRIGLSLARGIPVLRRRAKGPSFANQFMSSDMSCHNKDCTLGSIAVQSSIRFFQPAVLFTTQ